jgi:cellulose synthase/poly-beta-1,6-N-acetylglucosamine synthase-like glycosyltransferase
MNLQFGLGLAQALALLMSVTFITYVVVIIVPFVRHRPDTPGDGASFRWHVFIPARDEAAVIGETVRYTRDRFPALHVWVVDDASLDETAEIVAAIERQDPFVHLIRRTLPDARQGKSEALNEAYQRLDDWLPADTDRTRVISIVIDADGRLADDALDVCAGATVFGDPDVGSAQVMVRMMNRDVHRPFPQRGRLANHFGRSLIRMQDLEFRAPISAIQLARRRTRTVGLGGNGQFARLSALDDIAEGDRRPWRGALLEDYELSLHLLMAGYRNEYTVATWVDQEGIPSLPRLLAQRTRWGQGTMQCARYLPRLWASPYVSTIGVLEASYYLLQPWMQLIGTLVYPLPFIVLLLGITHGDLAWASGSGWLLVVAYTALGLGPFMVWGIVYAKHCESRMSLRHGLSLGLGYSLFIMTFYVTSWRAFTRLMRGRNDWVKTQRNEAPAADAVPTPPNQLPNPELQPAFTMIAPMRGASS